MDAGRQQQQERIRAGRPPRVWRNHTKTHHTIQATVYLQQHPIDDDDDDNNDRFSSFSSSLLTQLFDDDDPATAASEVKRRSCKFL